MDLETLKHAAAAVARYRERRHRFQNDLLAQMTDSRDVVVAAATKVAVEQAAAHVQALTVAVECIVELVDDEAKRCAVRAFAYAARKGS